MDRVASIADARVLKAKNLPLNTPVETCVCRPKFVRHWTRLMNAHDAFERAFDDYTAGPKAGSPSEWNLVQQRLAALDESFDACAAYVGKLGGHTQPPLFKSKQDGYEHDLLLLFLLDRAKPFIRFWRGAIEAANDGAELLIRPSDIPSWFD
ncbi:hypothetical protein ACNJX9_04340 [Bradyrhizobium sp. DASA03076]|uniref:hypothetical protein n=1 Tax=Bradyrhizobium sp. BLXBL-03 TaxID=3395916 RepID=UPI003F6E49DF